MPGAVRQQSRTGLPTVRSEISFRWSDKAKRQLLKLIKDKAEYRAAFFPTGIVVPRKSEIARNLLLELVKDEPAYLNWLKAKGLIKKNGEGQWVPLDTWTSTSYANPVITQLNTLKKTYEEAYKKYKIKTRHTTFLSVREEIRVDFKMTFPWFFLYKELAAPIEPFQQPPLPLPVAQAAPVQALPRSAPPAARPRPRAPPSPSPSDHSSASPSPSRSPSPPPSPPRFVAASSRAGPASRPDSASIPQRPTSTSAALLGTRPYPRPNAVASSSRIAIKVESSSSSSSTSTSCQNSDSDAGSDSESESEHEMENDYADKSTIRASMPLDSQSETKPLMLGKRPRMEGSPGPRWASRIKRPRTSDEVVVDFSSESGSQVRGSPGHQDSPSRRGSTSTTSSPRDEPQSPVACIELEGGLQRISKTDDLQMKGGIKFSTLRAWTTGHNETRLESRDRFMRQLRHAVGPLCGTSAMVVALEYAPELRKSYVSAESKRDRLRIEVRTRRRLFTESLDAMQNNGLLPRCLASCRLWFDDHTASGNTQHLRRIASQAGAEQCPDQRTILQGLADITRIRIRTDLEGLGVQPDHVVNRGGWIKRVRQYGFLAFGRWFYNRICSAIEGDYEVLPPPAVNKTSYADGLERPTAPNRSLNDHTIPGRAAASRSMPNHTAAGDRVETLRPPSETTVEAFKRHMECLRLAATPDDPSAEPEMFTTVPKDRSAYLSAVGQDAKDLILGLAKLRLAASALYGLEKQGKLDNLLKGWRIWVGRMTDLKFRSDLRQRIHAAGAIACHFEGGLACGAPSATRYMIEEELSDYELGPDTFVNAFIRLIYERLLEIDA